jgi:hypothetical protein
VTTSFAPAPWTGSSVDGYWKLEDVYGAFSHNAANVSLEFRTGIDQDLSDESFAFSHVRVMVR